MTQKDYIERAVGLLRRLIATPSVSRDEAAAASIVEDELRGYGFEPRREGNNVWAVSPHNDGGKPTLLLNAHVDTVKPVASWTRDPSRPTSRKAAFTVSAATTAAADLWLSCRRSATFRGRNSRTTLYISPPPKRRFQDRTASAASCRCCRKSTWRWSASRQACSRRWPKRD